MKELTNYQRTVNYLVKVAKLVDEQIFNNEIDMPVITVQSTPRAYAHVSTSNVWMNNDKAMKELNVSADYLKRPIENVTASLVHEFCHLYAMKHQLKDVSANGFYHTKVFKRIAESHGLNIDKDPQYGFTITSPAERIIDFCIDNGLEDIKISRETPFGLMPTGAGAGAKNGTDAIGRIKKPSSTRKYICPCCGNSVRSTKEVNIICGDCVQKMIIDGN